jgi:hypothetical protein
MAKQIISKKVVVNLNSDGTIKDGVFQYQLSVDGANNGKFYTVGIQAAMDEDTTIATNALMQKAVDLAKQAEGIE